MKGNLAFRDLVLCGKKCAHPELSLKRQDFCSLSAPQAEASLVALGCLEQQV